MKKIFENEFISWGLYIILCIAVFFGVNKNFQTILINGDSMNPTYNHSDLLIGQKLHNTKNINKDNVVVVNAEEKGLDMYIIKRVVAVENETVEIKNNKLYVNDKEIKDSFGKINGNMGKLVVPQGEIFVMGDNRNNSVDSRKLGTIPLHDVFAKIVVDVGFVKSIGHIADLF